MQSITKPLVWSGGILLLAVGGLFLYALKLGFAESLYSQRGTFAFFVTISEPVIRDFPQFDVIAEPQYNSSCGDGPKLPYQAVSYRSNLPVAELLALSRRFVTSHGYLPDTAHDLPGSAYASGGKTLYLNVGIGDDGMTRLDAQVLFDIYH